MMDEEILDKMQKRHQGNEGSLQTREFQAVKL